MASSISARPRTLVSAHHHLISTPSPSPAPSTSPSPASVKPPTPPTSVPSNLAKPRKGRGRAKRPKKPKAFQVHRIRFDKPAPTPAHASITTTLVRTPPQSERGRDSTVSPDHSDLPTRPSPEVLFDLAGHIPRDTLAQLQIPRLTLSVRELAALYGSRAQAHPDSSSLQSAGTLKTPEEQLYHPAVVYPLVALFVQNNCNAHYRLQIRRLFTKLDQQRLPPLLLNTMLAFVAPISQHPWLKHVDPLDVRLEYFTRAEAHVPEHLACPTVDTTLCLSLLSNISVSLAESGKQSTYHALAMRACTQLGWHCMDRIPDRALPEGVSYEAPSTLTGPAVRDLVAQNLLRELQRRAFWQVYYAEVINCCFYDMVPMLSPDDLKVDPIDDHRLTPLYYMEHWLPSDELPCLLPPAMENMCGYRSSVDFCSLAYRVATLTTQSVHLPPTSFDDYDQLNADLTQWYAQLPASLQLPASMAATEDSLSLAQLLHHRMAMVVHTKYHSLVILLNSRNYLYTFTDFDPSTHPPCHELSLQAAGFLANVSLPFFQAFPRRHKIYWDYLYYIQAGVKLVSAIARERRPLEQARLIHQTERLLVGLEESQRESRTAALCCQVIRKALSHIIQRVVPKGIALNNKQTHQLFDITHHYNL